MCACSERANDDGTDHPSPHSQRVEGWIVARLSKVCGPTAVARSLWYWEHALVPIASAARVADKTLQRGAFLRERVGRTVVEPRSRLHSNLQAALSESPADLVAYSSSSLLLRLQPHREHNPTCLRQKFYTQPTFERRACDWCFPSSLGGTGVTMNVYRRIVLHDITRAAGKTRQGQVHNIEEHTVFSDSTIHHH